MNANTPTPEALQWHARPASFHGPCPICGCPAKAPGNHRAIDPAEGIRAKWMRRFKSPAGWQYKLLRPRPPKPRKAEKPTPEGHRPSNAAKVNRCRQRMIAAARMFLDHRTTKEIAEALEVTRHLVYDWRQNAYWPTALQLAGAPAELRPDDGPPEIKPDEYGTDPGGLMPYAVRYLADRPDVSTTYRRLMLATVRKFQQWARRDLQLPEVSRAVLVAWSVALRKKGQAPATVANSLRMIRTLLLAAYDEGLLEKPPRRNPRIRSNTPPPEAWTVDQVRALLDCLGHLPGLVGSVPESQWWTALVQTVYWTGARIGALLAVDVTDYSPGAGITARQQKNGRQQWYPLPESCCRAIEAITPQAGPVFAWPYHKRTLWLRFRRYVERAGLPCPRAHGNLFHKLRRTNLSYCAAADPAIAQRQADHSSYSVTQRHYVDPKIARERSAVDVLPDPTQPGGDDGPPAILLFRGA